MVATRMAEQPKAKCLGNRGTRGGVSVGGLLAFCLVVLLIALGLAGYAWYNTRSDKARLEKELRQVQQKQQEADIERQKVQIDKQKAEDTSKIAIAKNQQESFAIRARSLTNSLETLLTQIPALQSQLERLRTGDDGKKVSIFPDLVVSARSFFQKDGKELPSRDDAVQKLESIRRILLQLGENVGTAFEPTAEMTATLDDTKLWVDTATRRLQTAKGIAETLLREAQIKVAPQGAPAQPPTLQAAMDALTTKEWDERQRIVTEKTVQAEKQATTTIADAQTNQIINQAEIEAERLKKAEDEKRNAHALEMAKKDADIEATKLRAEAKTSTVKSALAPFVTPGMWQVSPSFGPRITTGTTPRPMSFSALQKAGCLEDSTVGLTKLWHAASSNNDKMRPRWPILRNPRVAFQDEQKLNQVKTAQDYLNRLGPSMVELGILDP